MLQTIASAQADFRTNDRDGNRVNDFWREDISGLYTLENGGEPIKLIELSLARADDEATHSVESLTPPGPKAGYHFRVLRFDLEEEPDRQRFAACAFPAEYGERHKWTFIISHDNTIFRKDLGKTGAPEVYPSNPLAAGWTKPD